MAESVIKKETQIKTSYISGTTNSSGIINLTSNTKPIINVYTDIYGTICLLGESGNIQWAKVLDYNLSIISDRQVTCYYSYLDN